MLLRRFAYPCRYSDMIHRFGRPTPVLSMVTNKVLDFIYDTHSHKITDWNHALLAPALLQTYADVIYWIYRRDSETYSKARRISKGGVQREQNAPCFKISIPSTSTEMG